MGWVEWISANTDSKRPEYTGERQSCLLSVSRRFQSYLVQFQLQKGLLHVFQSSSALFSLLSFLKDYAKVQGLFILEIRYSQELAKRGLIL